MPGVRIWFKGKFIFELEGYDNLYAYYCFFGSLYHLKIKFRETMFGNFRSVNYVGLFDLRAHETVSWTAPQNISIFDTLHEDKKEFPMVFDDFFHALEGPMLYAFLREKDMEQFLFWLIKIYLFSRNNLFSILKYKKVEEQPLLPLILPVLWELRKYKRRYFVLYIFLKIRKYFFFIPHKSKEWVKENIGWWGKNIFSMLPFTILLYFAFHGYVYATIILSFWIGCRFIKYIARFLWSFYQGYFLFLEERIHFILQLPFSLLTSLYLLTAFSVLLENYYPDYIWLSVLLFSQIRLFFSLCKHWGPFIIEKATIYFKAGKD